MREPAATTIHPIARYTAAESHRGRRTQAASTATPTTASAPYRAAALTTAASAVAAAKKAFIVNRIGDLFLALGIFLTFVHFGSVEYKVIFAEAAKYIEMLREGRFAEIPFIVQLIPLLLMVGAFGKSAHWDVFGQYGRSDVREQLRNIMNVTRIAQATNAAYAPAGNTGGYAVGSIQCLINVDANTTNDDPNCVPLNRLGIGVADPAAIDYVLGDPYRKQVLEQYVAGANLSHARLAGATLDRANLERTNLEGADLSGAKGVEVDLSGADLSGSRLHALDVPGARAPAEAARLLTVIVKNAARNLRRRHHRAAPHRPLAVVQVARGRGWPLLSPPWRWPAGNGSRPGKS